MGWSLLTWPGGVRSCTEPQAARRAHGGCSLVLLVRGWRPRRRAALARKLRTSSAGPVRCTTDPRSRRPRLWPRRAGCPTCKMKTDHALALAGRSLSLPGAAELEVTALAWATQGSRGRQCGKPRGGDRRLRALPRAGAKNRIDLVDGDIPRQPGLRGVPQRDFDKGRDLIEESADLRRKSGDLRGLASSLLSLGAIAFADGDVPRAHLLYLKSLRLLVGGGGATPSRPICSRIWRACCWRVASRRWRCGCSPPWMRSVPPSACRNQDGVNRRLERTVRELTQAVGPETYASLWAEGKRASDRASDVGGAGKLRSW